MQTVQNINAEEVAKLFYDYRELLAPDFGCQSSEGCVCWEQIHPNQRNLLIAAVTLVLHDLAERDDRSAA